MKTDAMVLNNGKKVNLAGNWKLLINERANDRIAFAGARRGVTEASRAWIKEMVAKLDSDKHILVSGLAVGSDTYAHEAALENGIPQVAVLPSGVLNIYPRQNRNLAAAIIKNGGVLVSLLPNKAAPSRTTFLERNKLIMDLAAVLAVNQFNLKSGTRHTVEHAKKQGKLIVVQNGNYTGNKYIIKDGAYRTAVM